MTQEKLRVLLVEDEDYVARPLQELLSRSRKGSFDVAWAASAAEGIAKIQTPPGPDIVLLDLNLTDSRGSDTVRRIRATAPSVPIIVISGESDEDTIFEAMQSGANDYLIKGAMANRFVERAIQYVMERRQAEESLRASEQRFRELADMLPAIVCETDCAGVITLANRCAFNLSGYTGEELQARMNLIDIVCEDDANVVREAVASVLSGAGVTDIECRIRRKDGSLLPLLAYASPIGRPGSVKGIRIAAVDISDRKQIEGELLSTIEKLHGSLDNTVQVLAQAIEARDPYTAGHQRRVAALAKAMAARMALDPDTIEGIHVAGVLHDVGKISIPAEILSKPTRLTDAEFNLVQTHAQTGFDIIHNVAFPWPVARMVLEHHERMDGSGYPRGLSGGDILPQSRILGVADVVEAMSSHRPYRSALGVDKALEEITARRGTLYDPAVVDACVAIFKDGTFTFE